MSEFNRPSDLGAELLSFVEVFLSSHTAIDGLPQQVGEGELGVLPTAGVRQMLFDQFSGPESLVKFTYQDQTGVGSDVGTLEIDLGIDLRSVIISFTPTLILRITTIRRFRNMIRNRNVGLNLISRLAQS